MTIFRYSVSYGLAGCYMPDSINSPYIGTTRKDLAELIRSELEFHDMPKSLFNEVGIKKLWAVIKRHGSSSAHFTIYHKGYALSFNGLTEEEANADLGDD